jgi:hypothetical protein
MTEKNSYINESCEDFVSDIIKGIDRDVEKGEDALMLGLGIVMLSSTFAPVAPPSVLLPIVAVTFAFSAGYSRINYQKMERKLVGSLEQLDRQQKKFLSPIAAVFTNHPTESLADSLNPLLNLKRTWKSVMGGILINPFWMPIFYMMGLQIGEEKNLGVLNKAIISVENSYLNKHLQ